MNAVTHNINSIDLIDTSSYVVAQVDTALAYINGQRAKIGAQMNRLESVITNLQAGSNRYLQVVPVFRMQATPRKLLRLAVARFFSKRRWP